MLTVGEVIEELHSAGRPVDHRDGENGVTSTCPLCPSDMSWTEDWQRWICDNPACPSQADPNRIGHELHWASSRSYNGRGLAGEAGRLRFVSAAELHAAAPPEPPWVWHDYLARGAITLLAGKPKSGKSTLACAITEALAAGAPAFLGRQVEGGAVVYVSEEGVGTARWSTLPASRARHRAAGTRGGPKVEDRGG